MSTQAGNNKRIAKNTLLLYGRMLLTVGISFYSTRLILANLGIDNYGIYNVIGGFISMFYMITSNMTQAIGRFLTFELGAGDEKKLQQTFSTSINILLLLSVIIVFIAETIGIWFVNNKLNISPERIIVANWIYQFSILSFIFEMISVPYSASIISHEKMGLFALATIIKVMLTLGIALLLSISPIDKLLFYGISTFLVSIITQLSYWFFCKKNFRECNYSFHIDKKIFRNVFSFAGWSFLSTSTEMLSSQGVSILLNMYFGTGINAAQGVASQLRATIRAFSKNFMTVINPQITKSYASKDYDYSKKLVCMSSKFSYILFFLIALPFSIETDFFLSIWLKETPTYTSILIRLLLLNTLLEVLLNSIDNLNSATGKIKKYQILISVSQIFILLCSYLTLEISHNPILTISVSNVIYLIIFIPRIIINKPFIGITFKYYYKHVLHGVLIMSLISSLLSTIPIYFMNEGWLRFFITGALSFTTIIISSYYLILTPNERDKIYNIIKTKISQKPQ